MKKRFIATVLSVAMVWTSFWCEASAVEQPTTTSMSTCENASDESFVTEEEVAAGEYIETINDEETPALEVQKETETEADKVDTSQLKYDYDVDYSSLTEDQLANLIELEKTIVPIKTVFYSKSYKKIEDVELPKGWEWCDSERLIGDYKTFAAYNSANHVKIFNYPLSWAAINDFEIDDSSVNKESFLLKPVIWQSNIATIETDFEELFGDICYPLIEDTSYINFTKKSPLKFGLKLTDYAPVHDFSEPVTIKLCLEDKIESYFNDTLDIKVDLYADDNLGEYTRGELKVIKEAVELISYRMTDSSKIYTLSDIPLPEGYRWEDPDHVISIPTGSYFETDLSQPVIYSSQGHEDIKIYSRVIPYEITSYNISCSREGQKYLLTVFPVGERGYRRWYTEVPNLAETSFKLTGKVILKLDNTFVDNSCYAYPLKTPTRDAYQTATITVNDNGVTTDYETKFWVEGCPNPKMPSTIKLTTSSVNINYYSVAGSKFKITNNAFITSEVTSKNSNYIVSKLEDGSFNIEYVGEDAPESFKGKEKVELEVVTKCEDDRTEVTNTLYLTVNKSNTKPSISFSAKSKLNLFYIDPGCRIKATAKAPILSIETVNASEDKGFEVLETSDYGGKSLDMNVFVFSDNKETASYYLNTKQKNNRCKFLVSLEGYKPFTTEFSIPVVYKALSFKIDTVSMLTNDNQTCYSKLYLNNSFCDLDQRQLYEVKSLTEGVEIVSNELNDVSHTIKVADKNIKKYQIQVYYGGAIEPVVVTGKISRVSKLNLKMSKSAITFNALAELSNPSRDIQLTYNANGMYPSEVGVEGANSLSKAALADDIISYSYDAKRGVLHINSNMVNKDSNPDLYKKYVSGTKKYSFKIYGVETITPATSENPAVTTKSAPKTLSITITDKAPSVSFKKKGYISAFNSESQLTLIPVFKNIDEAVISEITISDKKDPLEDEGLFKVNVCDGNDCIINFTRYEECPNLDDYTSGTYSDEVAQEMKLYTKKYVNKKYKVYCTIKLNNCLTVNNTFDIKVEKRK